MKMINGEKYRDKLLKFIEERDAGSFTFSKGEEGDFWQCGGRRCSECGMSKERSNCSVERLKWLLSEYKEPIKLTRFEYDILKYLSDNTACLYIARDKSGKLFSYSMEPIRNGDYWNGRGCNLLTVFNKLFQFVQWEDSTPTSIKEVLKNCEVINDAEE